MLKIAVLLIGRRKQGCRLWNMVLEKAATLLHVFNSRVVTRTKTHMKTRCWTHFYLVIRFCWFSHNISESVTHVIQAQNHSMFKILQFVSQEFFFNLKTMKGTYKFYASFKTQIIPFLLTGGLAILSRPWRLLFHWELRSDHLLIYIAFYCWGCVCVCVVCIQSLHSRLKHSTRPVPRDSTQPKCVLPGSFPILWFHVFVSISPRLCYLFNCSHNFIIVWHSYWSITTLIWFKIS